MLTAMISMTADSVRLGPSNGDIYPPTLVAFQWIDQMDRSKYSLKGEENFPWRKIIVGIE